MIKEKIIKEVLELSCYGCNGKTFNCRGCTKEETIIRLVDELEESYKEVKKAIKEVKSKTKK